MTKEAKPNRRLRRLMERGYIMSQGVSSSWNPMDRARGLRHKKRYQQKQINKRLVSNGFRPKYKV